MLPNIYYGWWIVLASFTIAVYISGTVFFGLTAFFDPLVREFGWSYAQISFVVALRGLEMGIMAPLAGYLVDRYGSRSLVLFGTATVGLGLIVLSVTESLLTFYAAFLLVAFGAGGCTSVVLMTSVAKWFSKNIGKALGVMACGYGAGGLMIPPLVWLIDTYGWRTSLVCLGLGMWVLGIPLSFVIREKPEEGSASLAEGGENSGAGAPQKSGEQEMTFRASFRSRDFWALNVAEALRMMTLNGVVTHIMPYLGTVGVDRQSAGLVAAALPIISIAGRFGFGWMADLRDKRVVMLWAYGFMGVGLVAFTQAHVSWLLVPFLLFFPPGFGGSMILRGAMLREYFGIRSFGKLLGFTMGVASMGGMLGPPLAGWVFDTWGTFEPVWIGFCGFLALATATIWRIGKR